MRKVIFSVLLFSASTFCFGQTNEPEKKITTNIKVTGSLFTPLEAEEALQYHNKVRAEVGAPPLVWSKDLAVHAQVWADYLANNQCQFRHRTSGDTAYVHYGENLYSVFSVGLKRKTAIDASMSWAREKKDYTYAPVAKYEEKVVGHYTQMVWKNTKELGMGIGICPEGYVTVIVANYNPPGNYIGQFPY
jgi:uncharacterized protein YkwD